MELATKPQAVLFDWDNTLVDTWPIIYQALYDTFKEFDLTPWDLSEVKARVARSMRDSFPEIFGEKAEEAGARYQANYRKLHLEKLTPLPEAEETLKWLTSQNIPAAIVSNKKNTNLKEEIAHLNWGNYFQAMIGSGDAEEDKPSPAPAQLALKQMQLVPSVQIWFVGDSHLDLACARQAGLHAFLFGELVEAEHDAPGRIYRGENYHEYSPDHKSLLSCIR